MFLQIVGFRVRRIRALVLFSEQGGRAALQVFEEKCHAKGTTDDDLNNKGTAAGIYIKKHVTQR